MRARSTLLAFALACLLGGNLLGGMGLALAQKASGPPTPITPPPSVYSQAAPIPPPTRTATRQRTTTPAPSAATVTPAAVLKPAGIDCGAQLVVWANTVSRIYHFSTSDYYGHTKVGTWMCENDAKAQGMRPGRTEVRP